MDGEDKENKKKQTAPYTCDGRACPKTYSTRSGKLKHMKKCTFPRAEKEEKEKDYSTDENGLLRCKKCPVTFTKLVNFYYRHNKEIHKSEKKVKKRHQSCSNALFAPGNFRNEHICCDTKKVILVNLTNAENVVHAFGPLSRPRRDMYRRYHGRC